MKTTVKAPVKSVKTKAATMTTAGNVKAKDAPKVDPLPQQPVETKATNGNGEPEHKSVSEQAKQIKERAKQSDQFEYDDKDEAQAIYDKLPAGEFVIKEGNKTVIQKL